MHEQFLEPQEITPRNTGTNWPGVDGLELPDEIIVRLLDEASGADEPYIISTNRKRLRAIAKSPIYAAMEDITDAVKGYVSGTDDYSERKAQATEAITTRLRNSDTPTSKLWIDTIATDAAQYTEANMEINRLAQEQILPIISRLDAQGTYNLIKDFCSNVSPDDGPTPSVATAKEQLWRLALFSRSFMADDGSSFMDALLEKMKAGEFDEYIASESLDRAELGETDGEIARLYQYTRGITATLQDGDAKQLMLAQLDNWPMMAAKELVSSRTRATIAFAQAINSLKTVAKEFGLAISPEKALEDLDAAFRKYGRALISTSRNNRGNVPTVAADAPRPKAPAAKRQRTTAQLDNTTNNRSKPSKAKEQEARPTMTIAENVINIKASREVGEVVFATKTSTKLLDEVAHSRGQGETFKQALSQMLDYIATHYRDSDGQHTGMKKMGGLSPNGRPFPVFEFKPAEARGLGVAAKSARAMRILFTVISEGEIALFDIVDRSGLEKLQRNF